MKKNKINLKKIPQNGSLSTTTRIIRLITAYEKGRKALCQYMDLTHQYKQKTIRIVRSLKQELESKELEALKIEASKQLGVKLSPSKMRALVESEEDIPEDYLCQLRTKRLFDMQKIEEDLKKGKKIPGVRLVSDQTVEIDLVPVSERNYSC